MADLARNYCQVFVQQKDTIKQILTAQLSDHLDQLADAVCGKIQTVADSVAELALVLYTGPPLENARQANTGPVEAIPADDFVSHPSTSSGRSSSRPKARVNYRYQGSDDSSDDKPSVNANRKRAGSPSSGQPSASKRQRRQVESSEVDDEEESQQGEHGRGGMHACTHAGCTATFPFHDQLMAHRRAHRFEGCTRAYTRQQQLTIHERNHSSLKPYCCKWPNCDYADIDGEQVKRHVRTAHFGLPATKQAQAAQGIIDNRDASVWVERMPN